MNDELNLPWKIYFFNSFGKYHPKYDIIHIEKQEWMEYPETVIRMRMHNKNKLEIRICDSLDCCIMHFKDGRRIFP